MIFMRFLTKRTTIVTGLAALAAFIGMGAFASHAQTSGVYFAGYLGLSKFGEQKFSDSATASSGKLRLENSGTLAGALGLRLGPQIRVETELSYRNPDINRINTNGGSFAAGGNMKSWTGLLNVYYDFDTGTKFTPYLSGGFGFSHVSGELTSATTNQSFSDSGYGLAWQAGAGLKYRPKDNMAYTFGYRYLDTRDLDLGNVKLDYSGHEFRIGLEYDLNWR
ncbi:MAG: outer membrane protein [Alphaproteobacteria bacterium]